MFDAFLVQQLANGLSLGLVYALKIGRAHV